VVRVAAVPADVPGAAGFRGVLFTRDGADCAVLSLWEDRDAIAALAGSPVYQETVQRLVATGVLAGPQTVEVLEVHGGVWSLPVASGRS
jgi:heme-degrading monooxygenase HmoA